MVTAYASCTHLQYAQVLEARGLRARKHGELIDGAKLEPLLDAAEEWLYSVKIVCNVSLRIVSLHSVNS